MELHKIEVQVQLQSEASQLFYKKILRLWKKEKSGTQPETAGGDPADRKNIADFMIEECSSFKDARHDKGMMDKSRTILFKISGPLSSIATCAGNAAGTAFPAAPVIMVAFAHIIGACARLSEDMDSIEKLYGVVNHFTDRLRLLGNKLPPEPEYLKRITETFCAILRFCTKTHSFITTPHKSSSIRPSFSKDKSKIRRLPEYFKALTRPGGDEKLKEVYDDVIKCISNLDKATTTLTLATIMKMRDESESGVDRLEKALGGLQSTVLGAFGGFIPKVTTEFDDFFTRLDQWKGDFTEQRKKPAYGDQQGKQHHLGDQDLDPVERETQHAAYLSQVLTVDGENQIKLRETDEYKHFDTLNECPVLFISRPSGSGKSILSYSIYLNLLERFEHDDSSSVVYFAFDDGIESLQSVKDMLCFAAVQIATKDESYLTEVLNIIPFRPGEAEQLRDDVKEKLFLGIFGRKRKKQRNLVVVLDGVDHLPEEEQRLMEDLLSEAEQLGTPSDGPACGDGDRFPIRFILTGSAKQLRAEEAAMIKSSASVAGVTIALEKGNLSNDIKLVTVGRVQSLSQVRPVMKNRIVREIHKKVDSFIYVEHIVRRLSAMASSSLISQTLSSLPNGTADMDQKLWHDCQYGRNENAVVALQRLFGWLTCSKPLTPGAAARLLALGPATDSKLVIENEVSGRLSRALTITDHYDGDDDACDIGGEDGSGAVPGIVMPLLGFQERAFRVHLSNSLLSAAGDGSQVPTHPTPLMVFEVTTGIFTMSPANGRYSNEEKELILHASTIFLGQLLGLEKVSMGELDAATAAAEGLVAVLLNKNGALKKLEAIVNSKERNSSYGQQANRALNVLEKQARPDHVESGPPRVGLTAEKLNNRAVVSQCVAKGHIQNWFEADLARIAYASFRFAHQAFQHLAHLATASLGESLVRDEVVSATSFDVVADWERPHKTANDHRRIALAQFYSQHFEAALVLELLDYKMWEHTFQPKVVMFTDLTRIKNVYKRRFPLEKKPGPGSHQPGPNDAMEDPEEVDVHTAVQDVLDLLDSSLQFFSVNFERFKRHGRLRLNANMAYKMKAYLEAIGGGPHSATKAIESMRKAAELEVKAPIMWPLDSVIRALEVKGGGEYDQVSRLLIEISKADSGGKLNLLNGAWTMTHKAIHKAAQSAEEKETTKNLYLKALQESLEGAGDAAFENTIWLAKLYTFVLKDTATARKHLWDILGVRRGSLTWSAEG
ncbi:hypothetical protein OQA88_9420 [Cercophora sp. LCS_1]